MCWDRFSQTLRIFDGHLLSSAGPTQANLLQRGFLIWPEEAPLDHTISLLMNQGRAQRVADLVLWSFQCRVSNMCIHDCVLINMIFE